MNSFKNVLLYDRYPKNFVVTIENIKNKNNFRKMQQNIFTVTISYI